MIRTYSELVRLPTFEERYHYLALQGSVGHTTFGHDRYLNQGLYTSNEWRQLRFEIIARDAACDLAFPGREIHRKLYVHHMNPIVVNDIIHGNDDVFNPDYLITTTHQTHNAIHYGDAGLLSQPFSPRQQGDTDSW